MAVPVRLFRAEMLSEFVGAVVRATPAKLSRMPPARPENGWVAESIQTHGKFSNRPQCTPPHTGVLGGYFLRTAQHAIACWCP